MVTRNDLLVILRIGVHVAKLDGVFSAEEKHLLLRLLRTLGPTSAERNAFHTEGATMSELIGQLSSQDARELLLKMVCTIAQCDHRIEEAEQDFAERIHSAVCLELPLPPIDAWHLCAAEVRSAYLGHAASSAQR